MTTLKRETNFSMDALPSFILPENMRHKITGSSLVVNPSATPMQLGSMHKTIIPAFSSLILVGGEVFPSSLALVIDLPRVITSFDIELFEHWVPRDAVLCDVEKNAFSDDTKTPFYRSAQDSIGSFSFPASAITEDRSGGISEKTFLLKANLWAARASTHCLIHNAHDFVELHTQVLGNGRMQKFRDDSYGSMCEQVLMAPGQTTPRSFGSCNTSNDKCEYPFHQYYADTNVIWLALEYYAQ
jgi:hypothetical protein